MGCCCPKLDVTGAAVVLEPTRLLYVQEAGTTVRSNGCGAQIAVWPDGTCKFTDGMGCASDEIKKEQVKMVGCSGLLWSHTFLVEYTDQNGRGVMVSGDCVDAEKGEQAVKLMQGERDPLAMALAATGQTAEAAQRRMELAQAREMRGLQQPLMTMQIQPQQQVMTGQPQGGVTLVPAGTSATGEQLFRVQPASSSPYASPKASSPY
eukprot:TRINITY_DN8536_c0_g1_i1.p2 TRINITY_DN8536_c0_g1~~TRINITY_DN8536_c0_g1_i1.p2  ORF type:complete len:207 (+),score=46.46 TRINITY_DN8536_c0_g1_i1:79-699(+)